MTTIITWQEFLAETENHLHSTETKAKYAIEKVVRINKNISEDFKESLTDLQIDFCSVDEKGNIIYDVNGRRMFTKENEKKLNAAVKELQSKEIVIKPFYCTDTQWISSLSEDEKEIFKGIILE